MAALCVWAPLREKTDFKLPRIILAQNVPVAMETVLVTKLSLLVPAEQQPIGIAQRRKEKPRAAALCDLASLREIWNPVLRVFRFTETSSVRISGSCFRDRECI